METRIASFSDEELNHLDLLAVNDNKFACFHLQFLRIPNTGEIGFRFTDRPLFAKLVFPFSQSTFTIPSQRHMTDGHYLKWVGKDEDRRKEIRLYFIRENLELWLWRLDCRLKPQLFQFLMGSSGRLNPERDLPRQTRTYRLRDNPVRRFFDHYMFEEKLLPVIRDFLY